MSGFFAFSGWEAQPRESLLDRSSSCGASVAGLPLAGMPDGMVGFVTPGGVSRSPCFGIGDAIGEGVVCTALAAGAATGAETAPFCAAGGWLEPPACRGASGGALTGFGTSAAIGFSGGVDGGGVAGRTVAGTGMAASWREASVSG